MRSAREAVPGGAFGGSAGFVVRACGTGAVVARELAAEAVRSEGLVVGVLSMVWQGGGHVGLQGP